MIGVILYQQNKNNITQHPKDILLQIIQNRNLMKVTHEGEALGDFLWAVFFTVLSVIVYSDTDSKIVIKKYRHENSGQKYMHLNECIWINVLIIAWLTHWGWDNMNAISQTTFSSAFYWMKMYELRLKIHWSLFLRVHLTIFQHWFRLWLGAVQATSHYLNQCWLVYRCMYASLRLNELKMHN